MTLLHRLASIARRMVGRNRAERDLNDELETFVDMAAADAMRDGATLGEARRRAKLQLGGVEQTKERVRAGRHGAWLDIAGRDVRYALRQVRCNPAFSSVAIATLAFGIGGMTAMFSVFDAVLIRSLPYADADRLVMIWDRMRDSDPTDSHASTPAKWIELRRLNTVFTDLACTQPADTMLSGDGDPEVVPARKVTWNLWSVLGVQPALGRGFTEDEDNNGARVVIISHGLWQRRFGGVTDILGRKISLNDEPWEVIGVMPRHFYFMPSRETDMWIPASFPASLRNNFTWHNAAIVARLKPDITIEQAEQSVAALSLQVTAKDFRGPHSVLLRPLRVEIAGKTRTALILLLSASATLLLIACVNLTNLLLSRGAARGREVAVRAALGAARGRLVFQFLSESLVLAGLGTLAGLALALPAMRFLERLVPEAMGASRLSLDWRVLAFSAAAAVGAAVIFGLVPALRGARVAPQEALRDGGRGTVGPRRHWFQHSLIVVETALAVVLLTCCGLLLQTFRHLRNTEVGFTSERLLTFETPLFRYKDFNRRVAFINAELDAVRSIPGVLSASAINRIPFTNAADATFYLLEGQSRTSLPQQVALMRNVSRDYFATVGATLQEGRFFSATDQASKLPLAIINEPFAARNFQGQSPLGRRFKFGATGEKGYWYTIVGVVKPIREGGILEKMRPTVYRLHEHCDQVGGLDTGIVVRTAVEPASIIAAVRQAIWSLDKDQPLARIQTMEEIVDRQLSTPSQSTALLSAFALLALLLAALGIYGVLSYTVTQRTNEIGVRMALGATSREIMRSFGGQGLRVTLTGLAMGVVLAAIASRLMSTLLYEFSPNYVTTVAIVSVILLGVAALACLVPARRAGRIDPMMALRHD
jgi:putative ABC transport system permease protein